MIKKILVLLISINEIQADKVLIEHLKKIFKRSCSQTINNVVSINSKSITNCNLNYVNNFPKEKEREIKILKGDIDGQNKTINRLKNAIDTQKKAIKKISHTKKSNALKNKLNELESSTSIERNKLKILESNLIQLNKNHFVESKRFKELKSNLTKLNKYHSSYKIIIQNFREEQNNLNMQDRDFMDNLDNKYSINLNKIGSIENELKFIESNIYEIDKTLSKMEGTLYKQGIEIDETKNHVGVIQKETTKNTKDIGVIKQFVSKYIHNISNDFLGVNAQMGRDKYYMFGLEYEGYDIRTKSSIFVNLSSEHLNKEFTYNTLYGLDGIDIDNKKTIYGMEIGYRKFYYKINDNVSFMNDDLRLYSAVSAGMAKVKEDDSSTVTGKIALGLEYNHKGSDVNGNKFYIEGGYRYIDSIDISSSKFNPLGQGENSLEDSSFKTGYISIKYLWRL